MKKKILPITLCVAMLAIMLVSGTMAYFTDSDAKTNVFTVGNVDVVLHESTLHRQNDKASDTAIKADAAKYADYLKVAGQNMVPGRDVLKAPYVENTGNNAAYIRIIVKQSKAVWDTTEMMEWQRYDLSWVSGRDDRTLTYVVVHERKVNFNGNGGTAGASSATLS